VRVDSRSAGVGLRPLTARSVILSVLLGSHPPYLAVKSLVRTAELFGISEGTTRVALSRLAADGDVVAEGGNYRLSPRLVARQRRQDEGLHPATRPWRGGWELAVAAPNARVPGERATLRNELAALRLAELGPGLWTRPDNLLRDWPPELQRRLYRFAARPGFAKPSPAELAASLWDLAGWAERAERLVTAMGARSDPAERFALAAAIVRHLQDDPALPPAVLPPRWPGARLRAAYSAYSREMGELMRRERDRHRSG
jgi:phenylacetic acid degradation operon negative regulatory protein